MPLFRHLSDDAFLIFSRRHRFAYEAALLEVHDRFFATGIAFPTPREVTHVLYDLLARRPDLIEESGDAAARWRDLDYHQDRRLDGPGTRPRLGLPATRLGRAAGDRLVDPGAASEEPGRDQPRTAGRLQKKLAALLAEEEARHPDRPVALFCTDEHRIGLKPVTRLVWAPRGQRPTALGHHRYEWLYVTAFVAPATGESHWYVGNGVSKPLFERLLAAFAREAGAGRERRIVLLLDGAGWHTEPGLRVPEGLRLVYLPPYTPELQPAEHLWQLVDEPIVNQHFSRLAEIQDRIEQRCRDLEAQPDILQANTLFCWWPQSTRPN